MKVSAGLGPSVGCDGEPLPGPLPLAPVICQHLWHSLACRDTSLTSDCTFILPVYLCIRIDPFYIYILYIYLESTSRGRSRGRGRERIFRTLPAEHGALTGVPSHDPKVNLSLNQLSDASTEPPRRPQLTPFMKTLVMLD